VTRAFLWGGIALLSLVPLLSHADVGPPAHLRITEDEPGLFVLQWRVPKALPPRAVPLPVLPETCKPAGKHSVDDQAGVWLFTQNWRCEASLAGQIVDMRYPFADLALTTVVRVDLLSGDRFAHVLTPGEGPWRLPRGTAALDPLGAARRAVVFGISHVLGSWAHLVFILVVGLLGQLRQALSVVSAYTVGQLAGAMAALSGLSVGAAPAEIGLAIAVAVLAREVLRPAGERRRLVAVAGVAGLVHGLAIGAMLTRGLGDEGARIVMQFLTILGIDAVHLAGAAGVTAVWMLMDRSPAAKPIRTGLVYVSGAAGIALALGLAASGTVVDSLAARNPDVPFGQPAVGSPAAGGGSRRIAPTTPEAPIQSYLTVEPFEVRHEAMLRLAGLAENLDLGPNSTIEVPEQAELLDMLATFVLNDVTVEADDATLSGVVRRVDFMTVGPTGALPRTIPLPENINEAVVGVVVAYPTLGMPRWVSLGWDPFPGATQAIPATVIDPESVLPGSLSAAEPSLTWENTLTEDPIPTVEAVEIEPIKVPVPLLSLPLLVLAGAVLVAGFRRRRAETSIAVTRVILALALVVGPLAQTTMALPGSAGRVPSERQARRILAGLLPNIYRAMEFRDEAMIYDRLAVSVTGEALVDVYLDQRRALEMEERGGAQARVEAVEILDATEIERQHPGFGVRSSWTVGGMVTHFGHRHFRQNRYDARITIVPASGAWKIQSIEILEQDRVK